MEQPLDFSKSTTTIKTPSFPVKKSMQRFANPPKSLKNFGSSDYHVHNSENSDENTSRSSASSPDSLENEQATLALAPGHGATLSQQALLMLAAVSNQNLAAMNFGAQQLINGNANGNLEANLINQLNSFSAQSAGQQVANGNGSFAMLNSHNLNSSAAHAAAVCVSNMMNQQPQFNGSFSAHLNNQQQSNQQQSSNKQSKANQSTKASKSVGQKLLSRKSMIMAKQQEDESHQINQSATKFGILSNSQNSNILQIDADIESDSHSPLLNNSLRISINSNMSGEENSLFDMYSQDGGSPKSRRRGNPIPESLKDDSYWVRRKKNNEAAKKSRDAKRAKDLITAKRAILLENENSSLKSQLSQVQSENLILRSFLGEEMFRDEKKQINQLIATGRKVDPEKVRSFAQEFFKIFGFDHQERMES